MSRRGGAPDPVDVAILDHPHPAKPWPSLGRGALERRWRPLEARLQLIAVLSVLAEDEPDQAAFLERAITAVAEHADGGCGIAMLSADSVALHPLDVHHPDLAAHERLAGSIGATISPLRELERTVLDEGRGRGVQADATVIHGRPGLLRYLDLHGRRWSVVVPLRRRGRSIGVLWVAAQGFLAEDDVAFYATVASHLADTAEHLHHAGRTLNVPAAAGPVAALTPREREILALVADGLTSREIAEFLVISHRTVEWHRARIHAALGVSGRAELTRIARQAA